MKVAVTRSGGFAGLVRRAEVDSADHPAMAGLIDDVRLDDIPEPRPQPDRFVYSFLLGEREAARVPEPDLSDDLEQLARLVLDPA